MGEISLRQLALEVQKTGGRRKHRCYSIEGYRLIERALEAGRELLGVLVSEGLLREPTPRAQRLFSQLSQLGVPLESVRDEWMEEFLEGRTFGPLVGFVPLPRPPALRELLTMVSRVLVLYQVMDPGNLGALFRTARASGVELVLSLRGTDPFHPKAVRTSMGAIFHLKVLQLSDYSELIDLFRRRGFLSVGAVVGIGTVPRGEGIRPPWALFMGSEAHGLPPELVKELDLLWSIPMDRGVSSFSVNAAAAILLYELNREGFISSQ